MIKSFLFTGIICLIAELIKSFTKLSNGHITSLFVVVGSILSFFNVYDKLVNYFGGGALVVITSFGNTLYKTGMKMGILNMLSDVSVGIVTSIIASFIVTIIFKVKS